MHETNVEMLTRLMEYSRTGALMQGFVVCALERFAEMVIDAGAEEVDSPLVCGEAWVACAQEVKDTIRQHLSS